MFVTYYMFYGNCAVDGIPDLFDHLVAAHAFFHGIAASPSECVWIVPGTVGIDD